MADDVGLWDHPAASPPALSSAKGIGDNILVPARLSGRTRLSFPFAISRTSSFRGRAEKGSFFGVTNLRRKEKDAPPLGFPFQFPTFFHPRSRQLFFSGPVEKKSADFFLGRGDEKVFSSPGLASLFSERGKKMWFKWSRQGSHAAALSPPFSLLATTIVLPTSLLDPLPNPVGCFEIGQRDTDFLGIRATFDRHSWAIAMLFVECSLAFRPGFWQNCKLGAFPVRVFLPA